MSAGHILVSTSQLRFLRIQEKKQRQFFSNIKVEEVMKAIAKVVIAVVAFFTVATGAQASDRGIDGLIIGSGAGAIMGQTIGRNAEATILGATVGGILGAVIGAESAHHPKTVVVHERPYRPQYRPVYKHYHSHHTPRPVYREPHYRGHRSHGYGNHDNKHFARDCRPGHHKGRR